MRLLVTTESRFDCTSDGVCWSSGPTGYEFWTRYLEVFEEVAIAARVREVVRPATSLSRVNGPGVSVEPLPYYVGPWQYLRKLPRLRRRSAGLLRPTDALILRAPGIVAGLIHSAVLRTARPYGVEVVGDPVEVFSPGGVRSILRPFLRRQIPARLRQQCRGASAVAYVTLSNLPERYPAAPGAFVTDYSSIDLPNEAFASGPRDFSATHQPWRLLFIGSLEQMYKAPDVLIDTVGQLVRGGTSLTLTVIGDGRHRSQLEQQATLAGLSGIVQFAGEFTAGDAIRAALDEADLFVLPSRSEGLPRAMIEAMARGLPCVGTSVGGIPDLLSSNEMVSPGSSVELARKVKELLSDPGRLARLSRENLAKAHSYSRVVLQPRRRAFYEAVRAASVDR